MKKMRSILIICCILFTLCSCNSVLHANEKIRDLLIEKNPQSVVKYVNRCYYVMTDNVPITDFELPSYQTVEAIHYDTLQELLDELEATTSIVIKGKPTGETRQCIPYDAFDGDRGSEFTDVKIKVLDTYYGDVNVGDEIVLRQDYFTWTYADGRCKTYSFSSVPLDIDSEYLLVLHGYNESTYEGMTAYTCIDRYKGEIDISLPKYSTKEELYNKYIENKDTALDKANEAKKVLERKQMLAERYVYAKSQFKNKKVYKQVTKLLEQYPCSYDVLKSGLSDSERDLIERLVQKYGEK